MSKLADRDDREAHPGTKQEDGTDTYVCWFTYTCVFDTCFPFVAYAYIHPLHESLYAKTEPRHYQLSPLPVSRNIRPVIISLYPHVS